MKNIKRILAICILTMFLFAAAGVCLAGPLDDDDAHQKANHNSEAVAAQDFPVTDSDVANANSLIKQKKYSEAVAELTAIIGKDSNHRAALRLRAIAYRNLKQYDTAINDYNKAIKLDPQNFDAYAGRGITKQATKNYVGAIEDLTMAVKLAPQKETATMLRMLGICKYDAGDYPGSLDACAQSKKISENSDNTNCVGLAYLKLGEHDKAIKEFNSIIKMDNGLYYGFSNRAKAYLELANVDLANVEQSRKDIQKAFLLKPDLWKFTDIKEFLTKLEKQETLWKVEQPKREALKQKELAAAALKVLIIPKQRVFRLTKTIFPPDYARLPDLNAITSKLYNEEGNSVLLFSRWDRTNSRVNYESRGSTMGAKVSQDGSPNIDGIRWSVPEEVVPGQPAKFKIEGLMDKYVLFASIGLSFGTGSEYTLGGIRLFPRKDKLYGPNVPSDEFDLILPAIISHTRGDCVAGKAYPKQSIRLRKQDKIEVIVNSFESGSELITTPNEVPIEEKPLTMATCNNGSVTGFKVTINYTNKGYPLVQYTYKAFDDVTEDGIEFQTTPAGLKELRADGKDGVLLKARVKVRPNEPPPTPEATQNIAFSGSGEGAKWLDLSKTEMRDGWKVIQVQASNPDKVRGSGIPPATLTVRAETKDNDRLLASDYVFKVPEDSVIDAKPDIVEFMAKSGKTAQVKVHIDNGGKIPWKFRNEYMQKDRPLATAEFLPTEGDSVTLNLKEAGLDPESGGSSSEVSVLRIIAEQKDRNPLERRIKIVASQEGVFATTIGRDPEGNLYRVSADGTAKTTDVDFRVFLYDPVTKNLINDKDAVGKLKIESLEPEGSVAAQALKIGQLKTIFAGIRAANDPTGIYRFSLAKEIPGDGRIIPCDFKATYPGRNEENFTAIFTLGIVTTSNGPGGTDWQLELDRCQEVINKFVPPTYRVRMQAILDKHKRTLGAEGLHLLRNKIWQSAVDLTLGEGGRGYADEAAWADHITVTLEWAEWAGDMAFGAVIGTVSGPYGATGASMLKTTVISALNAYQDGRSAGEWLWENLSTIPGILEGKVIDVNTFEKMGVQSRAKAWAVYIGYHFCKNLYNGASVIEALKNTAKVVGSGVLSTWLSEKVQESVAKAPAVADGKPAPDKEASVKAGALPTTSEANAVQRIRSRMSIQGGKPYASAEDVIAIMRDPSMVRALKNGSPKIQEAFSNTREAIYRQHDGDVVNFVKENVPDMKNRMVKVMEFRTPGQDGASLNTDRDYRVCYYDGQDRGTGKQRWIEVDRRKWENHSYEAFARATGGPTDSPEAAKHWAEGLQQRGTDKYDAEASPAFSDQAKIWNPQSRKYENAQIIPNIVRVKAGQPGSRLKDPQALGQMYQMKVGDAKFKHEAFVQAQKAVKELDAIRKGYSEQNLKVGNLPPSMQRGMNTVIEVNKKLAADPNRRDPKAIADAEKTLRENGFQGLGDFMNKLSSQFESLKNVKE